MRAVIVLDSGKYPYHGKAADVFSEALSGMDIESSRVDMAFGDELHEKFVKIRSFGPDFLISFDLAGFALRTETDRASYNIIPIRMAHILFRKDEKDYLPFLGELFNFSMFFYAADEHLEQRLQDVMPALPNISTCPELTAPDAETDFDTERARGFIRRFAAEAGLNLDE